MKTLVTLSIEHEKPIQFDYWTKSLTQEVSIGVRASGEKLLVKNEDEYTSPIVKIYGVDTEYVVMTENTLYCVCGKTPTKRIA